MSRLGFHLTQLSSGDCLLDPTASMDISRQDELIDEILSRLHRHGARRLYYDLEDLAVIDPVHYHWLNRLARACRAVGVRMICLAMQPTAAFALAQFLEEEPAFQTARSVSAEPDGKP